MKIYADTRENHFEFIMNNTNGQSFLTLNGKKLAVTFQRKATNRYVLIRNKKTYNITIRKNEQDFDVLVNGIPFQVAIIDEQTKKMQEVIQSRSVIHTEKTIKAQIPGLIVDVMVDPGSEIQTGSPMLILEAMKMENVIKAPFDCIVSHIMVKAGETVNQNQVLLKIKPSD